MLRKFNIYDDIFCDLDEKSIEVFTKQIQINLEELDDTKQNKKNLCKTQKLKEKNENVINQDMVMKQAFLKDSNLDYIKKIEFGYFNEQYGEYYQKLHDVEV